MQNFGQEEFRPVVRIKSGALRGVSSNGVTSFKGIPFAKAPIGELRWRPPQAVVKWDTIRDARNFCADCMQRRFSNAEKKQSEDCLFLNVWTPATADEKKRLPVMVWIHGGGFVGGSGAEAGTIGDAFARNGVILITFNYRLGRFGHFAFPALSKELVDEPKGSYAYMDQIAALQWVRSNIAAFGGNPDNVTIFGFSAGGVSVHSLLTIPSAKGLFHKAIIQSGGGRDGVLTGRPITKDDADPFYPISAESIGKQFAHKHGIHGIGTEAMRDLRALRAEEILDSGLEQDSLGVRIYSGPILDGALVEETAETAYEFGRQSVVPLMIGNCSGEIGGGFVNASDSKEALFSVFGEFKEEAKNAYDPKGDKIFEEVLTKFNTDWVWGEPARMTARAYIDKKSPVYMYQFGYVPGQLSERMMNGAGHGSEIPYLFNTLGERWGIIEASAEDIHLSKIMILYWTNFAKKGNPNGSDLPLWPTYTMKDEQILDIETSGKIVARPDPRKERLDVIEKATSFKTIVQSRGGI